MKHTCSRPVMLVIALCAAMSGCATEGPGRHEQTAGTATLGGVGDYDDKVRSFVPRYIREHELLRDNELDFTVNDGVVTIRGQVDSEGERAALSERVSGIPGVREVRTEGVTVRSR